LAVEESDESMKTAWHKYSRTIIGFKVEEFSRETAIEKELLFQNLRI